MSGFVEVKTSDLIGAALDWAVTKAEILPIEMPPTDGLWGKYCSPYSPSTDWSQGGPLIQKYHMDFCCEHPETIGAALCDENGMYIDARMTFGSTHLEAACRALVNHKLGYTVSVPKELLS